MKLVLFVVVALAILSISLGDSKILQNIQIPDKDFSFKNENTPEKKLVIVGKHTLQNNSVPKTLQYVIIRDSNSYRAETFSLKKENTPEEELVIDGIHTQDIYPAEDPAHVYRMETTYVADKNGYHVKYKLVLEDNNLVTVQLSAGSLKSFTG